MYIHVTCASCSCQLNAIENMGDFGVVSYLADADGNVIVGPTTPVPTCRSTTPSTRSVIPTLTSNPQNKTRATPTPENQTPSTERPSTPLNQTSDTPILSNPNTTGETSANASVEDETMTAMLKGEKCCRNTLKPAQHSPECDLQVCCLMPIL